MPESETLQQALKSYSSAREALVLEEKRLRSDWKPQAEISRIEIEALKAVEKVRIEERENIWESEPTRPFLLAKPTIEKCKLFHLIKKMPKGALLHTHFDATLPASFLLAAVNHHKNFLVSSSRPLREEDVNPSGPGLHPLLEFKAVPFNDPVLQAYEKKEETAGLFEASYSADEFIPLHVARQSTPGGPEAWDKMVQKLVEIQPLTTDTVYDPARIVWTRFGSIFRVLHGMLEYEPILRAYQRETLRCLAADGLSYVEFRVNFWYSHFRRANGKADFTHADFIASFQEEWEAIRPELEGKGFKGFSIIYTTLKFVEPGEPMREYMRDCLELHQKFPNVIRGFDLVGHEDGLHTLLDYAEDLLWFQDQVKARNFDLPFVFHAGETSGEGGNLVDAILFSTKRIGHGFALLKHPRLMELVKERGILVEMCPISNELLRYTLNPATHPLPTFLAHGLPVSLSSDDATIFSNPGVSWDFYQAFTASTEMSILSLGKLARQSLEYSLLPATEKEEILKEFDARFNKFLEEVAK